MLWLWILLGCGAVAAVVAVAAFVCYRMAFSVPALTQQDLYEQMGGEQYLPHRETLRTLIDAVLLLPYEDVYIQAADGITLHAKWYASQEGAPVQILFHGYRSLGERDFCGGLKLALETGFSVLLVDERAHGKSGGRCLTFGVMERHDCLCWANYVTDRCGKDTQIILFGISMGAATVLMAAGLPLPATVKGILADCGYSSPRGIIRKVIRDLHIPLFPFYSLVRLGGRLFGGFDIEATDAKTALTRCTVPVLFIHGEDDRFVPCEMSQENYRCCASRKWLCTIPDAGHALSYLTDKAAYAAAVGAFFTEVLCEPQPG